MSPAPPQPRYQPRHQPRPALDPILRSVHLATVMGGSWFPETFQASGLARFARSSGWLEGDAEGGFRVTPTGTERVLQIFPAAATVRPWPADVVYLVGVLARCGGGCAGTDLRERGLTFLDHGLAMRKAFDGGLISSTEGRHGDWRIVLTLAGADLAVPRAADAQYVTDEQRKAAA